MLKATKLCCEIENSIHCTDIITISDRNIRLKIRQYHLRVYYSYIFEKVVYDEYIDFIFDSYKFIDDKNCIVKITGTSEVCNTNAARHLLNRMTDICEIISAVIKDDDAVREKIIKELYGPKRNCYYNCKTLEDDSTEKERAIIENEFNCTDFFSLAINA